MPIRVLVVDDSVVIRGLMHKALTADPQIAVAGSAANGQMAIDLARELKPDIIILDIEMPVMDGITALPGLMKAAPPHCKIIMASTLTMRNAEISMRALSLGAADYLAKPSSKLGGEVDVFYRELIAKVKALAVVPPLPGAALSPAGAVAQAANKTFSAAPMPAMPAAAPFVPPPAAATPLHVTGVKALAIASSTGGPQALLKLFEDVRGRLTSIPIFITQHMPPTFTTILADHITKAGGRVCREAVDGMAVKAGEAYLAPGDYHMVAEKNGMEPVLRINQNPPENFCRPAADPMLRSLSTIYGRQLAIVVLTGMGQDGMEGAKVAVQAGASVIAQNQESCVVYGMPKAVVDADLCRAVLPLAEIGSYLIRQIEGR